MLFLPAAKLHEALSAWATTYQVFTPQGEGENVRFSPYVAPPGKGLVDLDTYVNTAMSPKSFLFEEREVLFSWEGKEKVDVKSITPRLGRQQGRCTEGNLIFGVRPCDLYGLTYNDRFFYGEFQDTNYTPSRHRVFVVGMNCLQPGKNCFCNSMKETGPFAEQGYDMLLTPDGDRFWVECGTERGKVLAALVSGLLHNDYEDEGERRKAILLEETKEKFTLKPDLTRIGEALREGFNHKLWEEIAPTCIACTGCTRVCPTCTCFTTDEERTGPDSGIRTRVWDSCQAESFTRNAEFHNPRNKIAAVRYRIYDKLTYIEDRFNMKGCTGCGRCIGVCPAHIDIVDIAERLIADCPADAAPKTPTTVHYARTERAYDPQLYTPHVGEIVSIQDETSSIRRFNLRFVEKSSQGRPALRGQFYMLTVFGVGEIAISIPFSDRVKDEFSFYIKRVGKVTGALFKSKPGDRLGLRGPFGQPLPYETIKGRDLLVVGSGVGHAPVRATLIRAIENREDFGRIVVIASAQSYQGLILKDDLKSWSEAPDVRVFYALSKPTDAVDAHVGYVNDLLPDLGLNWPNTAAIICASPRRIKAVARDLMRLGMSPTDIYTALETNMHCGVGKCGHCKVGSHYMCVDGPVFTYAEMLELPPEF